MATSTEKAIATTTLGSAASTITFNSIPATYTNLRLVLVCKMTANAGVYVRFNNDNTSTYSWVGLYGDGTSAASYRATDTAGFAFGPAAFRSNEWGMGTFDVFSYTGSTYKTSLVNQSNDSNGAGYSSSIVSLWPITSAITRIDLINQAATTFAAGTTATLYGIL